MSHYSGFINIVGRPNVGKSTLMNALVGERMSIITAKPQTTRHRIIGLLSGDDFQMVFSDTPGIIEDPNYKMQRAMNRFVHSTFEDADILVLVIDPHENYDEENDPLFAKLDQVEVPFFVVLNKKDTLETDQLSTQEDRWKQRFPTARHFSISALHKTATDDLLKALREALPEGPAYYPKDQLSDRPERFFISEIIREKILEQYHQEIPYSVEVVVNSFKEGTTLSGDSIIRIEALLFVDRKTQKPILIGKGGSAIKKLGTTARKAIETFLESKVFLELHVKVRENWRDDDRQLEQFGYNH